MQINTINIQEYSEYLDTVDTVVFQQSQYHAKKFEHDGWSVEFIQASQENEVYATCMLAYLPLMKVFKYCYVARGFLADYKDKDKLVKFTSSLKQYLKKKNVVYLEMDPEIDLVQRDKDGNVVENGFNNYDVVENLKSGGFLQLPLKQGYDLSKECRFCSSIDLRGKTSDEIFNEFSSATRRNTRTAQKYNVHIRKLGVDQLHILDSMEKETSARQDFEAMSLDYFKNLYAFYGEDHVETLLSYLDLDEYEQKIKKEYNTTLKSIEKTKTFLEKNPGNEKKEKRLKTDETYLDSLDKKISHIQELKDTYGKEVPLACCLFIKYGHEIVYLVGSSNYEQRDFRGPYAIHWHMIQEAIQEGYDFYNFYGISGYFEPGKEGYGVFDFKRGYNAVVHEYIGNFILPCKPFIFKIYNKLKHIC
ncbi:peptidoglycan bridge formation glycyltransferase FemA/FemB family protein [uncultured Holdemanella sp.]|uniref:peptidoglycan bridge formation glycyltransferase FemA/FemB family protein n=1 Tax=uncultured Holdemanella sp. TaxID=1763549 RepID=UPI0025D72507|nr:peptidoglycan bridge formation glycyltransferase FemA/FemB family protein [uncultured Holdemanella sp.]